MGVKLMNFANDFQREWVSLRGAWDKYQQRRNALEGFEGKRRDDELEAARVAYESEVAGIHAKYDGEMRRRLKLMEGELGKGAAKAPSAEQLRLIELLKMRETLSDAEVKDAAAQLSDNELCMQSLIEIVNKSGAPLGDAISEYKPSRVKRKEALDVLRDRLDSLASWNGQSEDETVEPFFAARRGERAKPRDNVFGQAAVARMEGIGSMSAADVLRTLVKGEADVSAAYQLFD